MLMPLLLKADLSRNPTALRTNKAFHKISSEHETEGELNAAQLLIPSSLEAVRSTEMTLGLSLTELLTQSPDCWKLQSAQVCRRRIQSHSYWFGPVPVGEGVYGSLMEHFQPHLEAAGMYSHSRTLPS